MTKTIVLTDNSGKKFVLSGPTQIGRYSESHKRDWAVAEREKPEIFKDLEAIITIDDRFVSRNHAAIYKEDNRFYLLDLNSMNGSEVNGGEINTSHELTDGDIISFPAGNNFKVGFSVSDDFALIVSAGEDHPGAMENSLSALAREVRCRGYIPYSLKGIEATKQAVRDKIDEIKHLSVPESHILLYFHGHGGSNGIHLGGQILNPRELYQKIKQVRGKKAVIIDCCKAGVFVDENNREKIPEGTLVLAASSPERIAGETLMSGGEYIPRFSNALVQYLQSHRGEFNLKDFYNAVQNLTLGGNVALQEPLMAGESYTVPVERTEMCSQGLPARARAN